MSDKKPLKSDGGVARRRDEALRRALNTPPKPHKGKRDAAEATPRPASQQKGNKRGQP